MTGIVSKLDRKGFGIIEAQDGSRVPFLFIDVPFDMVVILPTIRKKTSGSLPVK
jgi:hypothetical protein